MKETDHEKLAEIIKDIHVAMMTTTDLAGKMHSRPMVTVAFERSKNNLGTIWFFSKKESLKVHDIAEEKDILLTYAHPVSQNYVVIHGQAGIERDKLKIVTLWNTKLKEWFPKGVDDPEMIMIKIEVLNAEIWDSPPSKTGRILGMAKSLVTGHPYEEKKIKSHQIGTNIH